MDHLRHVPEYNKYVAMLTSRSSRDLTCANCVSGKAASLSNIMSPYYPITPRSEHYNSFIPGRRGLYVYHESRWIM